MYKFTKSSYYLELYFNDLLLSTATGFFTEYINELFFVTNKHVATGRNPETGECLDTKTAALPNKISIFEPLSNKCIITYNWDSDFVEQFWIFHDDNEFDIAVIKVNELEREDLELVRLFGDEKWLVSVTEKLAIVGYPYGKKVSSLFPTYVTGFLATDLNLNFKEKPVFLIDSRTREGQSGSPVFYFFISGQAYNRNTKSIEFVFGDEENPAISRFMGIYSGRINKNSDLGKVWKKNLLVEMFKKI